MMAALFPTYTLPEPLVVDLRRQNPWWTGARQKPLPAFQRWPFGKLAARLDQPLAPIIVIRGPRQIGKTTLQQQLIHQLLGAGVAPSRILHVQFDDLPSLELIPNRDEPILRIADWFEQAVLGKHLNQAAHEGAPAFLFLDEIQNLPKWDVQLKSLVDHAAVRALVTGSSALRIERGRDSLAGRIQTIEVGPLRLTEIAALRGIAPLPAVQSENGWADWLGPDFWRGLAAHGQRHAAARDQAFASFSERGAYPFAQTGPGRSWEEIANHLNETVVKRVIQHDLRVGLRGRKRDAQLLEEVFRLACRYVGEAPSPGELAQQVKLALGTDVGPSRVRQYVQFLDSSLLIRAVPPLELRLKKRKGHDKLCLSDHAIRAAWLQESVPLDPAVLQGKPDLSALAGRIAESTVGYYFASLNGPDLAHFPQRSLAEPEVDWVLTVGDRRIPVEVKYQGTIDRVRDTLGLRAFMEKSANNATFGLLVTRDDGATVDDPRIVAMPLKSLLLVR